MSIRALRAVCIASILLNIFLVAAAIGGIAWVHERRPVGGSIRTAGAHLPRDERRAFREALREARHDVLPTVRAGRQARGDAAALLRAPMLDRVALAAALARARDADAAVRAQVETRAIAFAATLPPADRALLADGMIRRPPPSRK